MGRLGGTTMVYRRAKVENELDRVLDWLCSKGEVQLGLNKFDLK